MTTASYNVVLGYNNGSGISTGSGNILMGSMTATGSHDPVFGIYTENNRISLGSNVTTNAYVKVAWTIVSDARDKTNFGEVPHGLDFVKQLNPISYQFKESRASDIAIGDVKYGFGAQDILALEGDNPVIIDNKDEERLRYNGESLVPVLVKAIQEQQALITTLTERITALEGA
jgi:hypothetical protein